MDKLSYLRVKVFSIVLLSAISILFWVNRFYYLSSKTSKKQKTLKQRFFLFFARAYDPLYF